MIRGMHPLLWIAARALFLGVASFMAGGISRAEVFTLCWSGVIPRMARESVPR